ncbi:MAG TPA: hypothetical protein VK771_08585 [Acidimicrobiia bacterium]|jgi:hypothetical protein|nr:hypothetical protein [Acidimicrobiia bacterium]
MTRRLRSEHTGLLVGLICGLPLMAVGMLNFAANFNATDFRSFLRYYVGGDIVHDVIVAPIVGLIGIVVIRRAPAIARAPLRAALFGSAVVVAVAWPALRGYGRMRTPDNASVQPLNYATAVATVVGVVWVISALWFGVIWFRERRRLTA